MVQKNIRNYHRCRVTLKFLNLQSIVITVTLFLSLQQEIK